MKPYNWVWASVLACRGVRLIAGDFRWAVITYSCHRPLGPSSQLSQAFHLRSSPSPASKSWNIDVFLSLERLHRSHAEQTIFCVIFVFWDKWADLYDLGNIELAVITTEVLVLEAPKAVNEIAECIRQKKRMAELNGGFELSDITLKVSIQKMFKTTLFYPELTFDYCRICFSCMILIKY